MTPDRWQKVEELFHAALALAPDERSGYLLRVCPDDADLRAEVEALIREHIEDPSFLGEPVAMVSDGADGPESEGEEKRIGPYALIRTLGTGGMGEVFLAKRVASEVEHFVALKVVRAPVLSAEARARFANERSILARLNHPNIARFLHGDVTETGQPYLAMEYIKGVPITDYVRDREIGLSSSLDVFETVCDAVHYAHQNLVVHRDIKPGNILVTETGIPKLLDFGIAKLLEQSETSYQTRTEARVLTPEYASPEQLRGDAVSTATDVYSLGVLLYELLTGARPFDLKGKSPAEVERTVAESDPAKPSQAIRRTGTGAGRQSVERGRRLVLDDDLDTIVLTAMQPDPQRRYASVQQLADDIRRYRSGWPIHAKPDSVGYRVRKFVDRHRYGVAALSTIAILLIVGIVVTGLQSVQIRRQSVEVGLERDRAERVVDFLANIYRAAEPNRAKGEEPTVRELMDRGVQRLETELRDDPQVQAEMFSLIAGVYNSLGLSRKADTLHGRVLEIRRRIFGDIHPDVAATLDDLGELRRTFGDYEAAAARYAEGLRAAEGSGATDQIIELQHHIGFLHHDMGRYDEARDAYREANAKALEFYGTQHVMTARTEFDLAWALDDLGEFEEAEKHYRAALETQTALFGEEHTDVCKSMNNLGWLLTQQGRFDDAEPLLVRSLEIRERLLGTDHQSYAQSAMSLGLLKKRKGEFDAALPLLNKALAVYRVALGANHSYVAAGQNNVGTTYTGLGKPDSAEVYLRKALQTYRELFGDDHPNVATASLNLAHVLSDRGQLDEAGVLYRVALEIDRKTLGDEHHYVAGDYVTLATLEEKRQDRESAIELYRQALAIYDIARPDGDRNVANAQIALAKLLGEASRYDESVPLLEMAVAIAVREFGEGAPGIAAIRLRLAEHLVAAGRKADARPIVELLQEALDTDDGSLESERGRLQAIIAQLL